MLSFLSLAALLLTAAAAPPVAFITSPLNLTTTAGNTVRINDASAFAFTVDPGYPLAPEFTPVNGAPAMPTTTMTNQDVVVISYAFLPLTHPCTVGPRSARHQYIPHPERPIPHHVHLIRELRHSGNYPNPYPTCPTGAGQRRPLQPPNPQWRHNRKVNTDFRLRWRQLMTCRSFLSLLVPGISKVVSSWTTTLSDATTPVSRCSAAWHMALIFASPSDHCHQCSGGIGKADIHHPSHRQV